MRENFKPLQHEFTTIEIIMPIEIREDLEDRTKVLRSELVKQVSICVVCGHRFIQTFQRWD